MLPVLDEVAGSATSGTARALTTGTGDDISWGGGWKDVY